MKENIQYVEQSFLGCIMNDNSLINDTIIKPKHMTLSVHYQIYEAMQELNKKGFAIDSATLLTKIETQSLESVGGASYLIDTQSLGDDSKLESYEKLIFNEYQKKTLNPY